MNKLRSGDHNVKIRFRLLSTVIGLLMLSGCATTEVAEQNQAASKFDPYENINRKIYGFNDTVDDYVAAPISDAYRAITPQFVQTGIFNFFNNLKNINVVVNDVLQAKFDQGLHDTGRFAINSTVGVAGLFDVAKKVGLEQNEEDFDQTLAVWGVPKGPYLVLPLLGPSTARGIPGAAFDTAANPASYVGAPIQLVSLLNTRASAEGSLKFIDEAALDPYVFTRESFLQWRDNLSSDGKSQSVTDFDEELMENGTESGGQDSSKASLSVSSNVDSKKFEDASNAFGNAAQSFDQAAKSFEDAGNKVGQLKRPK
ncbi:MAG: MlaA family lipoprotein [Methylococcaceae bacterium]